MTIRMEPEMVHRITDYIIRNDIPSMFDFIKLAFEQILDNEDNKNKTKERDEDDKE